VVERLASSTAVVALERDGGVLARLDHLLPRGGAGAPPDLAARFNRAADWRTDLFTRARARLPALRRAPPSYRGQPWLEVARLFDVPAARPARCVSRGQWR
jgi:hypothetical protein